MLPARKVAPGPPECEELAVILGVDGFLGAAWVFEVVAVIGGLELPVRAADGEAEREPNGEDVREPDGEFRNSSKAPSLILLLTREDEGLLGWEDWPEPGRARFALSPVATKALKSDDASLFES